MDKKYAITILKWVLYKYYTVIHEALAVYQLIEADYNLSSQTGNVKAICDYLHFTSFIPPEIIHTPPDVVCDEHINRNPLRGTVIKAIYLGRTIHIELKHPRYNRSRSQLDLETRILKQDGVYYVVGSFVDFLYQMNNSIVCDTPHIYDTS